ncbi:MAG: DUF6524 family protein [Gammaproteobacteria bacterium]|nr:DUF6524 family protein [Gammaproteobacteria bacterium]
MTDNQISARTVGEPGFTAGSFFVRLLLALTVVLLSFNPSGFSFFHWTRDAFFDSSLGPLHLLAGVALLIGWVLFVQATRQSLGALGILLVAGLFAVVVWMLYYYDVVKTSSGAALAWIVLIGVAVVLTVGMSWAHLRRRLSGQATVDEVDS